MAVDMPPELALRAAYIRCRLAMAKHAENDGLPAVDGGRGAVAVHVLVAKPRCLLPAKRELQLLCNATALHRLQAGLLGLVFHAAFELRLKSICQPALFVRFFGRGTGSTVPCSGASALKRGCQFAACLGVDKVSP